MSSVDEYIENECVRDDNCIFMVLTDYFNNRTLNDKINIDNSSSLWTFVTYDEHDYTVLRYAYKLNVVKADENKAMKITKEDNNKFIHFNPIRYVDSNIIFSIAPVLRNQKYTIDSKFLYPLYKLYVLESLPSDNGMVINLMPLKPIINTNDAGDGDQIVYDINQDYTKFDHFKILLSNLIWFDIYVDLSLYQECKKYIRNYSVYRPIDVIIK
ncbi:GSCOCT00014124001.2-RA-CDS [Cotesia congregata]|uniref:Cc_ToNVorfF54_2 n=1 Tax=Cotesia congregata TaxID=51543 RepID=A0A8J2HGV0_COTCN|nr:GSCOCT00014124001.2-RA-CDS [Cotesia congregata]CAG5089929.1 Cc_ToNVorfF54_2 [Cotesia congregata]